MNTVDDLRSALDYPVGPARPDTAAIIARARRHRAVRRLITGGGVVTVAAAVAGVMAATSAAPHGGPTASGPYGGPSRPAAEAPNAVLVAAASPATVAPRRFDPMLRTLHVGSIPPGMSEQSAETGPFQQAFYASGANGASRVAVIILARGRSLTELPSGQVGMPLDASSMVAKPTDPVNGRPAECLSDPDVPGSCMVLRWQYAPGAWARASYANGAASVSEANAAVRAMAESVSLTAGERLRLPYTLTGDLAGMRVAATFVSLDDGAAGTGHRTWQAQLSLVDNETDAVTPVGARRDLVVELQRIDPQADPGHTASQNPNTTVDGHPAWLASDGRSVVVHFADDPVRLLLEYFARPGNALAAYPQVHPVATPDALTTWVAA